MARSPIAKRRKPAASPPRGPEGADAAPREARPVEVEAADVAIGLRARALRRAKGLRLQDTARRMGVSIGYLSQIERGLSSPSLRALVKLAETLDAPLASLFASTPAAGAATQDVVVRAPARDALFVWRSGVTKQLLTPPGDGAISMYLIELAPGANSGDELYAHAGEESGLVLEGALSLTVEEETWRLGPGDSFRFRSNRPHRFGNPEPTPARVLWVNVEPHRSD